jgi:hypothetical protein
MHYRADWLIGKVAAGYGGRYVEATSVFDVDKMIAPLPLQGSKHTIERPYQRRIQL